jgi:hypothetical protein
MTPTDKTSAIEYLGKELKFVEAWNPIWTQAEFVAYLGGPHATEGDARLATVIDLAAAAVVAP